MIGSNGIGKIPYGGDWNPEQWEESEWMKDLELLPEAGIDILTINVFGWAGLQRDDDRWDFAKLDRVMEAATAKGYRICLATGTAAHPAWMARKHPDILRVDIDGRKRKFGARHNSCPSSPTYRAYSVRLAAKLAERYGRLESLVAWHVSNEYYEACWCDACEAGFRRWLERKYGSIENVNRAWNAAFWGHTYYSFEDVVLPSHLSEEWGANRTIFQGMSLDWRRYNSDNILETFKAERDALKAVTPGVPVTTNLMGLYPWLDYRAWAREMDFISWDNYPAPDDPWTVTALRHAAMRGLKDGMPFALMEQTPSVTNWQPYNALKRPGVMRLQSYQAVANGADTVMFFQMRRSRGACEKFHGAVIDHGGHGDTRVFREVARLGRELRALGSKTLGTRAKARCAVMFDWDTWWALMLTAGPTVDLDYPAEIHRYWAAFARANIACDVVFADSSLDGYEIVAAPCAYLMKPGMAGRFEAFTRRGGAFLATVLSGLADESDLVTDTGYPGPLRTLLGVWVEETDALPLSRSNGIQVESGALAGTWETKTLFDVIHLEGAEAVGRWTSEFYAGSPALTRNRFGAGEAWYVGGVVEQALADRLVTELAAARGIAPLIEAVGGVEVTERVGDGNAYLFALNHGSQAAELTLRFPAVNLLDGASYDASADSPAVLRLAPHDVAILERCGP